MGTDQARFTFDALCNTFFRRFETTTLARKCQEEKKEEEESENEQDQGRASQQLVLPTPGGVNQDAPASKQGDRKEDYPSHQEELLWMKKTMTMWEDWCFKLNRKENSQGRDPSSQERTSQGEDPRTLEEYSEGGNVSTRQINGQRKNPRTFEAPVKRWRVPKKTERKEAEKEEEEEKEESEAQKKPLVDKAQRTICKSTCVGKERRRCEGKRLKVEQDSQGETTFGKIWKMALLSFDSDAE